MAAISFAESVNNTTLMSASKFMTFDKENQSHSYIPVCTV